MSTALRSGAVRPLVWLAVVLTPTIFACAQTQTKAATSAQRSKDTGVVNCHVCTYKQNKIEFDLMDDDLDGLANTTIASVTFFGCDPEDLTFDAVGSYGNLYNESTSCAQPPCLVGEEEFSGLSEAAVETCDSYALTLEDNDGFGDAETCPKDEIGATCP